MLYAQRFEDDLLHLVALSFGFTYPQSIAQGISELKGQCSSCSSMSQLYAYSTQPQLSRLEYSTCVNVTQLWHKISDYFTFVLLEVKCILLVSDNLLHVDHTSVFELPQDLDLSDGCDGEALLFIVQTYFLQSDQFTCHVKKRTYHNEN